jgi:hypothetical protein
MCFTSILSDGSFVSPRQKIRRRGPYQGISSASEKVCQGDEEDKEEGEDSLTKMGRKMYIRR